MIAVCLVLNLLWTRNPKMGTLANNENTDEMPLAGITSGSALFANIKQIFEERNTLFFGSCIP